MARTNFALVWQLSMFFPPNLSPWLSIDWSIDLKLFQQYFTQAKTPSDPSPPHCTYCDISVHTYRWNHCESPKWQQAVHTIARRIPSKSVHENSINSSSLCLARKPECGLHHNSEEAVLEPMIVVRHYRMARVKVPTWFWTLSRSTLSEDRVAYWRTDSSTWQSVGFAKAIHGRTDNQFDRRFHCLSYIRQDFDTFGVRPIMSATRSNLWVHQK